MQIFLKIKGSSSNFCSLNKNERPPLIFFDFYFETELNASGFHCIHSLWRFWLNKKTFRKVNCVKDGKGFFKHSEDSKVSAYELY